MGSIQATNEQGRLLVAGIEEKARWFAGHTVFRYTTANWETDGYRSLTWSQWADAIDRVAYWLDKQLGKSTDVDTVAYLGPNDIRYSVILPAAIKTGRKLLVPDGRVTEGGLMKLLEETQCKTWIYAVDDENGPPKTLDENISRIALPSLQWCLDTTNHKRYPYRKTWDEGKHDEILVIHTSGTTGLPKPIFITNGFFAAGQAKALSKKHWPRGIVYDTWMGKTMLSSCPPQWLGGLLAYISMPVYHDITSIIPPPDATAYTPTVFKKLLKLNLVDGIMCPPHTIIQLYNDPDTQPLLKALDCIIYLGAAMDQEIGDDLAQHTKLTCFIGSTETGPQTNLLPIDKKLWHTHDYVPENGNRMIRIEGSGLAADGSDDLYELVLEKPKDGPNLWQAAFWNPMFKYVDHIRTKELYSPIKDSDGRTRWVFSARKDDLTKLNWLAKFHAQDIEKRIQKHPDVASVFVGGEGRPTPYVIIEPKPDILKDKSVDVLLGELYEGVIRDGNDNDVDEIGIPKETVFVAKAEKPFKRSHKQTLMRKEIEKDYKKEIEEAYERLAKARI